MCDQDGSPLEPDPEYVLPSSYRPAPSKLHGNIKGQVSIYSRQSGKRKWTTEEQMLLWRTVQKVPLEEQYPLKVAWYLHGESGVISNDLEDFNPQHMKDKMKSMVEVRCNNQRPVEGRARFWLPPFVAPSGVGNAPHPAKVALEEEVAQAVKERRNQEREAMEEAAEEEQRRKDAQKAKRKGKKRAVRRPSTEDELESDNDEDEVANILKDEAHSPGDDDSYEPGPVTRSKRGRGTNARAGNRRTSQKSTRAVAELATANESEDVADADASGDVAPGSTRRHQPTRRRRIPYVEVPPLRSISSSKPLRAAPPNVRSASLSRSHDNASQHELPPFDLSESEAETDYGPQTNGKMMRRSIGQGRPDAETESLPSSASEDEEETDEGVTQSVEQESNSQGFLGDEVFQDDVDEETASTVKLADDATQQQLEAESDEDETERNERLARRFQLQQKILGGE